MFRGQEKKNIERRYYVKFVGYAYGYTVRLFYKDHWLSVLVSMLGEFIGTRFLVSAGIVEKGKFQVFLKADFGK